MLSTEKSVYNSINKTGISKFNIFLMISFNQLIQGFLGNIASSLWFIPYGANFLHKIRGVKFEKFVSVYIGRNVLIDNRYPQKIYIKKDTVIAPMSIILAHSFVPKENTIIGKNEIIKKVFIGKGVFIGANSIILPGSKLGDYCYVAAGSVVSGTFPKQALIAGNPAKIKRLGGK